MIGVRDIKEEDEVEEGEVHLEEELLPCKQIKEEQSGTLWMLYNNEQQAESQHLQLYEQQQQQFSQTREVKEERQEQLKPQQQQQQIQIQELKEQQRQEQQEQEHQHKKLQQQQQGVEQHQQQQQHLLEQQQWEAWQQERDPLEIEQPLGGEEVHLMPNLLTLKPGVIFQGSSRMMTAEEEDEDEDDEEMNAFVPSREKTREMEKQYLALLPLYEDTLRIDAFDAAAARGFSAVPSNILPGIMKEQRQLGEAVKKEWKEQLLKKTKTTLQGLEQQLKALQADEEEEPGGGVGSKRKALEGKMNTAMAELLRIKETKLDKVSHPPRDTPLDWERISAHGFDGTRSAKECQLMWNHLLHPSINRKAFTKEEDLAIQRLVRCKGSDWGAIAKALWTQRTGFLVMHRWMSFSKPKVQPVKWNKKDTKKLLDAVSLLRQGKHIPWSEN